MQITVNNTTIHYKIINQGNTDPKNPALVFLHDGLGSIRQWKDIPQKICDALHLKGIIYDRAGYGMSASKNIELNADYLHDEAGLYLHEILQKLKIQNKVILIGHSDGGSIALLFASFFPDKVTGVVSEAAHIFVEEITLNGIKNLKSEYQANYALLKSLKKYHGDKTEKLFSDWTDLWLSNELRKWNIEILLKNIKAPVLAIQGTEDEYGSIMQLTSLKKNIETKVNCHLLPGCGHFPHFEKEQEVLLLIKTFINQIITEQTNNL